MGSDRARAYRSFEPGRARERIDCRHRILRQAPGQVLPAGEQRPKRSSQSVDRARCTLNKQAVNGRNMFVYTGGAVANAWGGVRTSLNGRSQWARLPSVYFVDRLVYSLSVVFLHMMV